MTEPLVTWREEYATGVNEIDEQHKVLLNIINELHSGLAQGSGQRAESFQQAARKSVMYIKEHFSSEENLMQRISYPDYAHQKKQHVYFITQLLDDVESFDDGDKFAPGKFLGFLTDWLLTHIMELDSKIGTFVRENEITAEKPEKPTPEA